jgi:hypothetical protein
MPRKPKPIDHDGEISDTETLTHVQLAKRFRRDPDWVKRTFLFPVDETGRPLPGVPHWQAGMYFMISGRLFRLWVEEQAMTRTAQVDKEPSHENREAD